MVLILLFAGDVAARAQESFELVAAGDVMLSRGVGRRIAQHGIHYPFEPMRDLLTSADLTFANLECVLATTGSPMPRKEFTFRAIPETAQALQAAGIDVVSVANNHTMDFGADALLEMNDILAHHGIAFAGGGRNATSAHREALLRVGDLAVALLAYSENFYLTVEADATQPGAAVIAADTLQADIRRAKSRADLVLVSMHWGWEYLDHPTDKDRERAHLAIDAGADLVLGHHPHVIQGVERYKQGVICYSLGNFVFDQKNPVTHRGLVLRCTFNAEGIQQAEWIPISIHPQEFRPRMATGEVAESILAELAGLSKKLQTSLQHTPDGTLRLVIATPPVLSTQIAP